MDAANTVFGFLNDQLLKMKWLWDLVRLLVEKIFGMPIDNRAGGSIHFFIYDIIKIFILLSVLIFVISYIQSYFPPERTKKILGGIRGVKGRILGGGNPFAVLLATVVGIPIYADIFGTIPIAEALMSKGAGIGTVLSFYDGGNYFVTSFNDYVKQSDKTQIVGSIYNYCYNWHYNNRICF